MHPTVAVPFVGDWQYPLLAERCRVFFDICCTIQSVGSAADLQATLWTRVDARGRSHLGIHGQDLCVIFSQIGGIWKFAVSVSCANCHCPHLRPNLPAPHPNPECRILPLLVFLALRDLAFVGPGIDLPGAGCEAADLRDRA